MDVAVVMPCGKASTITIAPDTLVSDLKLLVADREGLQGELFDLSLEGEQLHPEKSVSNYGVCDMVEIQVEPSRRAIAMKRLGNSVTESDFKNVIKNSDNPDIVSEYIYAGMSADIDFGGGKTPLYLAAKYGRVETCRILLSQHGVDPNKRVGDGYTAFSIAVSCGEHDVVKLLLDNTDYIIEFNSDEGKRCPFLISCQYGDLDLVRLIWHRCYSTTGWSQPDWAQATPLMNSCRGDCDPSVLQFLLSLPSVRKDINFQSANGESALFYACLNENNEQLLDLLLDTPELNVNLSVRSWEGMTPLMLLCSHGTLASVTKMVEKGADINNGCYNGRTPLLDAVSSHRLDIVKYLCSLEGINKSAVTRTGVSAVSIAALFNDIPILQYLMTFDDINVNAPDEFGLTALQVSCAYNQIESVRLLLQHPLTNVNCVDSHGMTPVMSLVCGSESISKRNYLPARENGQ